MYRAWDGKRMSKIRQTNALMYIVVGTYIDNTPYVYEKKTEQFRVSGNDNITTLRKVCSNNIISIVVVQHQLCLRNV